jgi:hypothetical protein
VHRTSRQRKHLSLNCAQPRPAIRVDDQSAQVQAAEKIDAAFVFARQRAQAKGLLDIEYQPLLRYAGVDAQPRPPYMAIVSRELSAGYGQIHLCTPGSHQAEKAR